MSETSQAQLAEYDEMFAAVQRYQQGDPEAALLLLEKFSDFLEGFVLLLRGQKVKRLTYSHRVFVANFMKHSGLARALKTRSPMSPAVVAAESAMTSVSTQLKPIDEEDLRQEAVVEFLALLRRYRSRNNQNYLIPYILKSFPYAMTRRVQALIKDPLVNLASDKLDSLVPGDDGAQYGDHRRADNITVLARGSRHNLEALSFSYEQSAAALNDDELGNTWLRGEVCDDAFDCLTYAERKILKAFYFEELTDAEIAEELGVSYNTAIRRRHHIEAKLCGEYEPPTCRWCSVRIPKAPLGRQPRQCTDCRRTRKTQSQRDRRADKETST